MQLKTDVELGHCLPLKNVPGRNSPKSALQKSINHLVAGAHTHDGAITMYFKHRKQSLRLGQCESQGDFGTSLKTRQGVKLSYKCLYKYVHCKNIHKPTDMSIMTIFEQSL